MNPRILFALILVAALGGCGAGSRPQNDLYVLKPHMKPMHGCTTPAVIEISEPDAGPGLETRRIAVMDDARLNYYTGAKWAGAVPQTVQSFLIDAFEQSQAFRSVGSDAEGVRSDLKLVMDIRDFQVTDTSAATVRVHMTARVMRSRNHAVAVTIPIDKTVSASANHMPDIVEAFNQAMDDAAFDIIQASLTIAPRCKREPKTQ